MCPAVYHADGASKRPVAQHRGDGPHHNRTYARRSSVPERAGPIRPRRRVASTSSGARVNTGKDCALSPGSFAHLIAGGAHGAVRSPAARHRPRVTAGAHRGQSPLGGPPPAGLRSRSPRVPGLPRRPAHRRFITPSSVIDQILAHLRTRAARESHAGPRSPPSTRAPVSRGALRAPRPSADTATSA
jgi:hypothetical protein